MSNALRNRTDNKYCGADMRETNETKEQREQLDLMRAKAQMNIKPIRKGLREMPPADAVEVIRCKDCRFYFFVEGKDHGECDERIDSFRPFYPNDFCSYGERIDND